MQKISLGFDDKDLKEMTSKKVQYRTLIAHVI